MKFNYREKVTKYDSVLRNIRQGYVNKIGKIRSVPVNVMKEHITAESGMHEDHQEYFHKQRMDLCLYPSVVQQTNSGLGRLIAEVPISQTNVHDP
jgi:hypothetical protein